MVRLSAEPGDQRVQRGGGQWRRAAHADPHVHAYGHTDRHCDTNPDHDHDCDANRYREIFEANKPMLTHPDKIDPGQMLRIPPKP